MTGAAAPADVASTEPPGIPRAATSGPHGRKPRRLRVAYVNNFPVAPARLGHRLGRYPDHHLYGSNELGAHLEVEDWTLPAPPSRRGAALGPVAAQLAVLRSRPDLVYSANLGSSFGLALAATLPAAGRPVVSLCHDIGRSPTYARALRLALRSAVATITLSARQAQVLVDLAPGASISRLSWGPDLSFEPFRAVATRTEPGDVLVSLGKTRRDTGVLLDALEALRRGGMCVPAVVCAPPGIRGVPSVEVVSPRGAPPGEPTTYLHVMPYLRRARVVAIPLATDAPYVGLTELLDAMACGLPVIHTSSPHLDIDVEEIGCGLRVPPADTKAWTQAIGALMSDPEAARAMGLAGRRWLETSCNSRLFGRSVAELVARAL